MTIDWTHFTPLSALIGGLLIGVAAAAFVLVNGRVAGVSGIVGGLLRPKAGDAAWRAAFVIGLIAAPLLYQVFAALPEIRIDAQWPALALAGAAGGSGHAVRFRMHQRSRSVRPVAVIAALVRRYADIHGRGIRDGVCGAPSTGTVRGL